MDFLQGLTFTKYWPIVSRSHRDWPNARQGEVKNETQSQNGPVVNPGPYVEHFGGGLRIYRGAVVYLRMRSELCE